MIQIGDIRVHLINDCFNKVDAGGAFGLVPRALWHQMMPVDEHNLVPMAYHNLLVQTKDKNILIDVGYGEKIPQKFRDVMQMDRATGGLLGGLSRLNIAPSQIDLVINTHLHGDHCGGNTILTENWEILPTFPNAEYVVQRREYQDAIAPNERTRATYIAENFQPLVESGQMRLLDGDTEFTSGIRGVVTPGHTPGHMSVIIESAGQTLAFLCDMSSYAIHFERLGWMTAYDVEPLVTLETKRKWQQWAVETNALLIFPHDKLRPLGTFAFDERGRGVVTPQHEPYS